MTVTMPAKTRGEGRHALAAGLIAACMVLAVYAALGVWPAGGGTVITGDLNAIYMNMFAHFKRAFAGEAGFAYSFSKGLGGGLAGTFAYHAASPLNLLYLLVPLRWFPAAAAAIFLVKTSAACALFRLYIGGRHPGLGLAGTAVSLGYGFMAYSFAYAQNIMWHDVLVLLPLVCLGVDRIVRGGRFTLYALALAAAILANFYIAYMACIFTAAYFVWGMLCRPKAERAGGLAAWRAPALRFAAGSLAAAAVNAAFLLPALADVARSKGVAFSFSANTLFPLWRLPERLLVGSFTFADMYGHMPFIYCGALTVLLAVCYFAHGAVPLREKLLSGGIILAFLLSFWVEGADSVWHGFRAPVWFPARYSFLLCFFMAVLAARALAAGIPKKVLLAAGGALSLLFVIMAVFPAGVSRSRALATAACAAFAALALVLMARTRGGRLRRALPCAGLLAAAALELCVNGFYIADRFEKYPLANYQAFADGGTAAVRAIERRERGDFRVAGSFFRSLNDPMLLGFWGVSFFSSTQDAPAQSMLRGLGYLNYGGAGPYGRGGTAFADSVLGMRGLASDGSLPVPSHWQGEERVDGGWSVYTNPYALPPVFAAMADSGAAAAGGGTLDFQNALFAALGGEGALLTDAEAELSGPGGGAAALPAGIPAGTALTVRAAAEGYHYLWLDTAARDITVSVNGGAHEVWMQPMNEGVLDLGFLRRGEAAEVRFVSGAPQASGLRCVRLDAELLSGFAAKARRNAGDFTVSDGLVRGGVYAEAGMTLFTSIPWDEGWAATVNGREVKCEAFAGGFVSLPLSAGENSVVLRYAAPAGGAAGWIISLCGAAVIAFEILWIGKSKKRG